ncbi:hypothetical protein CRG98_025818 [Punica granatum]|uniref:DUF7745 domain-containing protein n=1 Tax=Punica granatum TaxID=22663 RepID=A0A2I0JC31_PUNGR|nr:hypothetical protein CRG98_025818 [Punica granatum]
MARPTVCPRLDHLDPPGQQITCIWSTFRLVDRTFICLIVGDLPLLAECPIDWTFLRTAISFWDPQHAVFNFQGTELTPTVEEYTALIQRSMPTQHIIMPNQWASIPGRLSDLLGMNTAEINQELQNGWEHSVRTLWLENWTYIRALHATDDTYQRDAYHGFLSSSSGPFYSLALTLIDGALAQVVLQAVGGHSYVEALVAETVRSLDYVRASRRGRMRGSLHLLQIWLFAHIRPFCSSHPLSYIADDRSLVSHLLRVFGPSTRSVFDWKKFMEELTLGQFLWASHWNPGGPMVVGCPAIIGLPLISYLGCTLFPTNEERAFSATSSYVVRFYPQGLEPAHPPRAPPAPRAPPTAILQTESSVQAAMRTKLQTIKEERDRLRRELANTRAELTDQRELQRELAQTRARGESLNREIACLSATQDQARAKTLKVLTTGGAPPISHTLPIKNGRRKSTCCLRREYTTDAGLFSIVHDERATTTYPCRRATSTSRSSLGPSPTTNFNEHATTAGVRATTTWVCAATRHHRWAKSLVFELHPASRTWANCRPRSLGPADNYLSAHSSSDARAGNSPGPLLPTLVHHSSNCLTSAHDNFCAESGYVRTTSRVRAGSNYSLHCSSSDGLPDIERLCFCSHY